MEDIEFKPEPDFYKKFASWLLDCDFSKKVAALQAFTMPAAKEKFHVLCVGDPGSGKSELMTFLTDVVPNSSYVGQRTTPVGMVEELERCDAGIMGAEEFDKMSSLLRNQLLEMMEAQRVKVTKHGFSDYIQTRTNVFAICNPRGSMLNEMLPLHTQLTFAHQLPLLQRFHLIIPFKSLSGDRYGDVAVSLNYDNDEVEIMKNNIKRYLIKVKQKFPKITLTDEMSFKIGEYVAELKDISRMKDLFSPRTIVGFRSALQARTRMNFRTSPIDDDFNYVKKIFDQVYFPEGG